RSVGVGREPLSLAHVERPTTRRQGLVGRLTDLFTRHTQLIGERQPQTMLNQCGYQLGDVLEDGNLNLGRLLAGSEGTLAIITKATLATSPMPRYRGGGVLFFD